MRHPLRSAIDKFNTLLGLEEDPYRQDWAIECADPRRLREFIECYDQNAITEDEKFTLMALILGSFEEYHDINLNSEVNRGASTPGIPELQLGMDRHQRIPSWSSGVPGLALVQRAVPKPSSTSEFRINGPSDTEWALIKSRLEADITIHGDHVEYYSCMESEDPEEWFPITPQIRQLHPKANIINAVRRSP